MRGISATFKGAGYLIVKLEYFLKIISAITLLKSDLDGSHKSSHSINCIFDEF